MNIKQHITASVIGASGYSGMELVRLLSRHPRVKIASLVAQASVGKAVSEFSLATNSNFPLEFSSYSPEAVADSDVIFSALPSGESISLVSELIDAGKTVIDLSGDFRLQNPESYKAYYGKDHTAIQLTAAAAYGLSELNRDTIRTAQLISNPGCYATSCILPLVPLIENQVIQSNNIVISSLSGISGAGKKNTFEYSFTELNDSVQAYRIGKHQHVPEIEQAVKNFSGNSASVTFVPHLVPISRGIHTTIIAPLSSETSTEAIHSLYNNYYATEPFVSLAASKLPALKRVQFTNMIEIGWAIDRSTNSLVVLSTLDNLLKGAAGQAVQNMNIRFNFEETLGL